MTIILLTVVAVLMACSLRGDIALVAIFIYKSYLATTTTNFTSTPNFEDNSTEAASWGQRIEYQPILPDYLQLPDHYNMKDLLFYALFGVISSQITFQVDTQCIDFHSLGAVFSQCEYGYCYFLLSFILLFLWIEARAYYLHSLLHTPWLYKNCHKQHHRYHCPTAYSVIAMSPVELSFFDGINISPLFLFPIHGLVYVAVIAYVYYFGMMDHSGIKMTSWFPWQPETMFHDDHHRYFHVNFGFNSRLFDWLHDTLRQPDREYGEDIFGGKGQTKKAKKQ